MSSDGEIEAEHSATEQSQVKEKEKESTENGAEKAALDAFSLFRTYMDRKLNTFKRDIQEEHEDKLDDCAKKIKKSEIKLNNKGNKVQFEFNQTLLEKVEKLDKFLVKKDITKCKSVSADIQSSIQKRNKLIRIADKSQGGWKTVTEYESDEVASDSEDEKKIRQAEYRALKNIKQQKKKDGFKPKRTPSATITRPDDSNGNFRGYDNSQTGGNRFRYSEGRRVGFKKAAPSSSDMCFGCFGYGHWRANCPKTEQRRSANQ